MKQANPSELRGSQRPPRDLDPSAIVHVSARTFQQRLLFVPDEEFNQLIGGILARYQEMHGVEIFAYNFLSNHLHLQLRCPHANLDLFMRDVNREIAHRVNRYRGRDGAVFSRRYSDQQILDEEADGLQALLYIACNPVHHGLTHEPQLWPGLTFYHQLIRGGDKEYQFFHHSEYNKALKKSRRSRAKRKRVVRDNFYTDHKLRLSPLPRFADLSHEEMLQQLRPLIADKTREIQNERYAQGLGFIGRKAILAQDWDARPQNSDRSPKPACYTKNPKLYGEFKETQKERVAKYRKASKSFRRGDVEALSKFPSYCRFPAANNLPPHIAQAVACKLPCYNAINLLGQNGNGPIRPAANSRR